MASSPTKYDVIVTGGGVAGLNAARIIAEKAFKKPDTEAAAAAAASRPRPRVLLLEADDRLGGRVHTLFKGEKGLPCNVDVGASFIHGVLNNPLSALASQLHLRLYDSFPPEMRLCLPHQKGVVDASLAEKIEFVVFAALFQTSRDVAQRGPRVPRPEENLWDSVVRDDDGGVGLYEGLDGEDEKQLARSLAMSFSGYTGADLSDVSFKYWGWEREFEGGDVEIIDGYIHVVRWLEQRLRSAGGQIRLGEMVKELRLVDDGDAVEVVTPSGSYLASYVINTFPLGVLQNNPPKFDPPLPVRRISAIKRLGFGVLDKLVLVYSRVWWDPSVDFWELLPPVPPPAAPSRSSSSSSSSSYYGVGGGSSGMTPHASDPRSELDKRPLMVKSLTQMQKGSPVLVVFMGGSTADLAERCHDNNDDDEAVVQYVLGRMADGMHGDNDNGGGRSTGGRPPKPIATHFTRWRAHPFSFGSYSYIPASKPNRSGSDESECSPLDMVELGRPLWDERLGFAGEATDENHFASVHGAYISGEREALRVNALLDLADEQRADEEGPSTSAPAKL